MKLLKSKYHEVKSEEFELEIIEENETEYIVQPLPGYNIKTGITTIRKCIVGKNGLYDLIEKPVQLYLDI